VKKNKKFDCVQMKRGIQQQILKEFAAVPDEQAHRIQMERVMQDPILGPFCKKLRSTRQPSKK
jgi:hypothetical protein